MLWGLLLKRLLAATRVSNATLHSLAMRGLGNVAEGAPQEVGLGGPLEERHCTMVLNLLIDFIDSVYSIYLFDLQYLSGLYTVPDMGKNFREPDLDKYPPEFGMEGSLRLASPQVKNKRRALLAILIQAAGDADNPEVACESLRVLRKVWGHIGGPGYLRAVASQARIHLRHVSSTL